MGVSQDGAVRPYVPPSAAGAGAMCLASAVMLHSGWLARESTSWVSWVAVASCVVLSGAALGCSLLLHRFRIGLRWFAGGLAVGCLACTAWLNGWHSCKRAIEERPVSSWWLVVASEPAMGPYGCSVTLELRETPDSPALARVRATTRQPLDLGACMRAVGRFEELDDSGWARSRFMKGEVASMRIVSVLEREQLRTSCIESVKSLVVHAICPERDDARALLAATICGRTTELATSEAYESFRACGLTHLVAVSGGHLAYIAALMEAGLQHLRLGCVRQRVILLIVLSAYVMFTGASPSAVRSVSMVGAASLAVLGRRRAHGLSGLAVAVMILVAANPGVVFDVGFQLSAVSVLFMLVFARYGAGALESAHVPARIAEPLSLTLVAQWATLPITMPLFGEVSLVAPLANLIVGPVMTALLVTGLAGSGLAALASGAAVALPLAEGVCAALSDALLGAPWRARMPPSFSRRRCRRYPMAHRGRAVMVDALRDVRGGVGTVHQVATPAVKDAFEGRMRHRLLHRCGAHALVPVCKAFRHRVGCRAGRRHSHPGGFACAAGRRGCGRGDQGRARAKPRVSPRRRYRHALGCRSLGRSPRGPEDGAGRADLCRARGGSCGTR